MFKSIVFNTLIGLCFFMLSMATVSAQDLTKLDNEIYQKSIKTVIFQIGNLALSYPIIDLNSSSQLLLSFDDIRENARNFNYRIIHCDQDWKPSSALTEMDFLEGFNNERIRDFQFSYNTKMAYTHYVLRLPNRDTKWTISGNYVLQVYEDIEEKPVVLSRRFMVVEPLVQISPKAVRPIRADKASSHHEIDLSISYKGVPIKNPMAEINISVLQNGNWQNAITRLRPLSVYQEVLNYNYQDKITFPAMKEFRGFDMRSLRSNSGSIEKIDVYDDAFDVYAQVDPKRANTSYNFYRDLNGLFVVENFDYARATARRSFDPSLDSLALVDQQLATIRRQQFDMEAEAHALEGEYAYVYFGLHSPIDLYGNDVYMIGAFTDWKLKPEFKMKYSTEFQLYEAEVLLKQGYYEYLYATVAQNKKDAKPDYEEIEGSWFGTENDYTVLVYYKPFGSRYTRLIGTKTFSSADQQ